MTEDALLFGKPGTRLTGEHELSELVLNLDLARKRRLPAVRDALVVSTEDEGRSVGQFQFQLVVLSFQLPIFAWDDKVNRFRLAPLLAVRSPVCLASQPLPATFRSIADGAMTSWPCSDTEYLIPSLYST